MDLNVQILSRDIIKPFFPSRQDKRIYRHSLLDQLTPQVDVDTVLFYPNAQKYFSGKKIHDKLKLSLSKALTHYYPLAGRAIDALSITCNDEGVSYIEAQVASDISRVIRNPVASNLLTQLVPEQQLANLVVKDRALMAVQVNTFAGGGLAIAFKVSHSIADASALASFLTHWAGISRDPTDTTLSDHGKGFVVDCTSLFPPKNFQVNRFSDAFSPEKMRNHRVVKRFVFEGSQITRLRQSFQSARFSERRPTRFVALATLIWAAIINVLKEKDPSQQTSDKSHIAFLAANLRKRINPPLSERSLGSIFQITTAEWPMNRAVELDGLAGKLRDSTRFLQDTSTVMDFHSGDKYFNWILGQGANLPDQNIDLFHVFSSWCRFPFYETDFGWGKPDLVGLTFPLYCPNMAIFVDSKDGEGIEAWLGLPEEDMARFERDPGILEYASFSPGAPGVTE